MSVSIPSPLHLFFPFNPSQVVLIATAVAQVTKSAGNKQILVERVYMRTQK